MIAQKPRWLRFSLRTLLVVTTLVGIVLGLIGIRWNQLRHQWQAIKAIRDLGGVVWYDDEQYGRIMQTNPMATLHEFLNRREPIIAELSGKAIQNNDLQQLIEIPSLKIVFLANVAVTNEGLKELKVLDRLQTLVCTRDSRHDKIFQKLDEPTYMDFQDTPLEEVIRFLKDLHKIDIVIDEQAFTSKNAGQIPITFRSKDVALGTMLDELLRTQKMGWIIADGKVVVTTREITDKNHRVAEELKKSIPSLTDIRID